MSGTGNIELDLVHRVVALQPKCWKFSGRRNIWDGPELITGGEVAEDALFVEHITTRHDTWEDTQVRYFDFELLRRFARGPNGKARQAARQEAVDLYDALNLSGGFTGVDSGGEYKDIRAIDSPVFLDDRHYSLNVTVWRIG